MLRRQNLRRSQHSNLVPILNRNHRCLRRYNRFPPATHIALQQPVHRMRLLHVVRNLLHHAPLRRRRL